jgi:hypothetical protein
VGGVQNKFREIEATPSRFWGFPRIYFYPQIFFLTLNHVLDNYLLEIDRFPAGTAQHFQTARKIVLRLSDTSS